MIKIYALPVLMLSCFSSWVCAGSGLVSSQSQFSVSETADRFEQIAKQKGLTIFARINHADNAAKVNLSLRPSQVILFGNAKVGTPLMQCAGQVAIDLPQKASFWQDKNGKVWLSYNAPDYLKKRHKITGCDALIGKITNVLQSLAKAASAN